MVLYTINKAMEKRRKGKIYINILNIKNTFKGYCDPLRNNYIKDQDYIQSSANALKIYIRVYIEKLSNKGVLKVVKLNNITSLISNRFRGG